MTIGDNRVAAGSTMRGRVRHQGRLLAQSLNPGLTVIAFPDMNATLGDRRNQVQLTVRSVTVRLGSNAIPALRRIGI